MPPRKTDAPAPDWSWLAAFPEHYFMPGATERGQLAWYQLDYDFALVVYGRPAPQGSKRHVGNGRMVESSAAVKPWREAVRSSAVEELERWRAAHLDGQLGGELVGSAYVVPVAVRMVFTLPCPARAKPGDRPGVVPDLSKLVRSTEDALVDAGVLADDKLIVEFDRVAKVYPRWDPESLDRPGAVIKIRRL